MSGPCTPAPAFYPAVSFNSAVEDVFWQFQPARGELGLHARHYSSANDPEHGTSLAAAGQPSEGGPDVRPM